MNIVYASDDRYAFLAGTSILSVLKNNCALDEINVFVLEDGLSDDNKRIISNIVLDYDRNLFYVSINDALSQLVEKRVSSYGIEQPDSYAAYARLFVGEYLKEYGVDKVLYLDCDTVCDGYLGDLYDTVIPEGYCALAVRDYTHIGYKKYIGLKNEDVYYNSGVMLIDLDKWHKYGVLSVILKHLATRSNYTFADQDLINVCIRNRIGTIDIKYNVQTPYFMYKNIGALKKVYSLSDETFYTEREYIDALTHPVIYHYSGMVFVRPWYSNSKHPARRVWRQYFEVTDWVSNYIYPTFDESIENKIRYYLYKVLPSSLFAFVSKESMNRIIKKVYV